MCSANGRDGWQPPYHPQDCTWSRASSAAQLVNGFSSRTPSKELWRWARRAHEVLAFQHVRVGGTRRSLLCFWLFWGWMQSPGMQDFHRTHSLWRVDDLKQQTEGPDTQRKNTSLKTTVREEKKTKNFPKINCYILPTIKAPWTVMHYFYWIK